MAYKTSNSIHPYFSAVFTRFQAAFQSKGYSLTSPSGDGYIMEVTVGDRRLVFSAEALPINSAAAHVIARDKLGAYQLLEEAGLRVPKGFVFFADSFRDHPTGVHAGLSVTRLRQAFDRTFAPSTNTSALFVVKPGRESHGIGVQQCRGFNEVEAAAQSTLLYGRYGLVQEFVSGAEFRVALLDDDILVVYRKHNRVIQADGYLTERGLITRYNQSVLDLQNNRVLTIDLDNLPALAEGKTWQLDRVPPAGESLELAMESFNLSHGAWPEIIRNPPTLLIETARLAQLALGLRYSGVDLCVSHDGSSCTVFEVNGNPGFSYLKRYEPELVTEIDLRICQKLIDLSGAGLC